MTSSNTDIRTETFEATAPGKTITFFGGIHGNEICGIRALEEISEQFKDGSLSLKQGKAVFVPCCNAEARLKNVRFIESNLNRIFRRTSDPKTYEERLANELAPIIEATDILIDLHSMTAAGPVTLFIDYPTPEALRLSEIIQAPYILLDWPKIYEDSKDEIESHDTTRFAHEAGKSAVLLECGQHEDPAALGVAKKAVLGILASYGMIDSAEAILDGENKPAAAPQSIRMEKLFMKRDAADSFPKDWNHLDAFKQGELLATKASGEAILAPFDGYIILPKRNHAVNTEWFYVGRAV